LSGDMNGNAVITHVAGPSSDAPGTGASTAQEVHPIATFSDHTKYVVRTRWSPDGQRFATASYDKSICLYGCEAFCYTRE
jgi:WD40 repeat protein